MCAVVTLHGVWACEEGTRAVRNLALLAFHCAASLNRMLCHSPVTPVLNREESLSTSDWNFNNLLKRVL